METSQADHGGYEQTRPRGRPNRRNATDIGTTYVHWMHNRRPRHEGCRGFEAERPSPSYIQAMLPPAARPARAADTIPAKHLHSSLNKVRHPINVVKWTPEGRRLLTASASGEFTLWNGTGFNFETIMQAHDTAVRALAYAHNDEWLLSSDDEGVVKYWQNNFNNVKQIQAHGRTDAPIRDLAFAPTDSKFVTASDDSDLKIFDFAGGAEEMILKDHSWSVKSVDWHPTKGLLVSGAKDHQVKLWDPRTSRCLTTLHGHKHTVSMTRFEPSQGNLLASCARDQAARVFDIRMMRDVFLLPLSQATSLVWHPIHTSFLTVANNDGEMLHYLLDEQNPPQGTAPTLSPYDTPNPSDAPAQTLWPAHKVTYAHEYAVWSMDWHPMGHILASGSNDKVTRFWTRSRPGDSSYVSDRWHIGQSAAEAQGTWKKSEAQRQREEEEAEAEDEADGLVDQKMPSKNSALPGLPGLAAPSAPSFPDGTSTGGAQPIDLPNFPNPQSSLPPNLAPGSIPPPPGGSMDLARLIEMAAAAGLPSPPNPPGAALPGFPPFPAAFPPAGTAQPQQLPPGIPPPPGLPGYPYPPFQNGGGGSTSGTPAADTPNGSSAVRKRGPLPSQKESLREEQRQGRYTKAR